ncbi:MAG: bifunctional homocysteine S-methyltransferase/methylenetetrahydrofolate reductase [Lentisphaerae bacterium]|nr:bifunctional homocysteine S-methyltransferase/methylenetetrahydrofolate reductase [Lentisphaerota bacterium]
MPTFLEHIHDTPVVFDGAMGTMLYARGVFINTCYDELNLVRPDLVKAIHAEYVHAGADVIETNSFGANRVKLRSHGLADKVADINRAAARVAREIARTGSDVFVAGSVGPCMRPRQLWMETYADEFREAFREQMVALAEGGVDVIYLETFDHLDELRLAAAVAHALALPVFASFTVSARGETIVGREIEAVVAALQQDANVDGIGINCGIGPQLAYDAVERALPLTTKPFVVMPNAGMPREVEGRMIYMTSPEYFTSYAKKFIELGVRGIGGCCGTQPEHIRQAAKAVKSLSGVKKHITIKDYTREEVKVRVIPTAEKSGLAAKMMRGEKVTSVELLPPKTIDLTKTLERVRLCHARGVDCINIPDGPRASARVSPMVTSQKILDEVGIEPVLHYCCRDRNLIGMQSDLLGGYVAGLRNFLIITGDPPKLGDYPDATGVFDVDAIGLTLVAHNLNNGRDIGGNPVDPPTGIFIGVGANPCALALDQEIARFFKKIDAGAEFAVTQPIFDPDALFHFLDRVEAYHKRIPVIAGVWPLLSFKNAEFMRNEVPGVTVPDAVLERMSRCSTKEDGIKVGIEIAQETCARIASRVAGFQVSAPLGRVEIALAVLQLDAQPVA